MKKNKKFHYFFKIATTFLSASLFLIITNILFSVPAFADYDDDRYERREYRDDDRYERREYPNNGNRTNQNNYNRSRQSSTAANMVLEDLFIIWDGNFEKLDANGDSQIGKEEQISFGENLFQQIDADQDEIILRKEFVDFTKESVYKTISNKNKTFRLEYLQRAEEKAVGRHYYLDKNLDNEVNKKEFNNFYNDLFKNADENKNGSVDFNEHARYKEKIIYDATSAATSTQWK